MSSSLEVEIASSAPSVSAVTKRCACAKGHVAQLTVSAIQKTQLNNAKKAFQYVLDVRRSDGSEYSIKKTFGDFICLNNSLPRVKDLFVEKKLSRNEIPKLPDRVEKTKDIPKLNRYIETLLRLQGNNAALDKAILKFCGHDNVCDSCRLDDLFSISIPIMKKTSIKKSGSQWEVASISSPLLLATGRVVANYKSDDKRQLSLQKDTIIRIFKQCPTGWWYVIAGEKTGWFPATYVELLDKSDTQELPLEVGQLFKADRDYVAHNHDELSFNKNDLLTVKRKHMDGWWFASGSHGNEGFVPATYLRPCDPTTKTETSDCEGDICRVTLDMKQTMRRSTSEFPDDHHHGNDVSNKKAETLGVDLASDKEILDAEKNTNPHHFASSSSTNGNVNMKM